MLEECDDIKSYWQGVDALIRRWLAERDALLEALTQVMALFQDSPTPAELQALRNFCQVLMDYISAGHFEVYEQLIREGKVFADSHDTLFKQLFPRITQTTDVAVTFNDTYDTDQHCAQAFAKLPIALTQLSLALKERFALEDQLIDSLHRAHRNLL